jgi:hypothetical protein
MNTMPPGIITQPRKLHNGMIYAFSHRTLGELGKLTLTDAPGGMQISAEAAQGDISDPKYLERLEILSQVVQTLLNALPGENAPMPGLEAIKQKVRLYQGFIGATDADELERFARSLKAEEQRILFDAVRDSLSAALQTQDLDTSYGIVQREQDLRRFLDR